MYNNWSLQENQAYFDALKCVCYIIGGISIEKVCQEWHTLYQEKELLNFDYSMNPVCQNT